MLLAQASGNARVRVFVADPSGFEPGISGSEDCDSYSFVAYSPVGSATT